MLFILLKLHYKSLFLRLDQSVCMCSPECVAVSQYQVCKVQNCVLSILDFASSTWECELPRTGGHKSGKSANGTAAFLLTSVSSTISTLYYYMRKYDIKHHCIFLFSSKHINSRKNVVQGTYIHYSEILYQTALPLFCLI